VNVFSGALNKPGNHVQQFTRDILRACETKSCASCPECVCVRIGSLSAARSLEHLSVGARRLFLPQGDAERHTPRVEHPRARVGRLGAGAVRLRSGFDAKPSISETIEFDGRVGGRRPRIDPIAEDFFELQSFRELMERSARRDTGKIMHRQH
jgi:hypothetical protein